MLIKRLIQIMPSAFPPEYFRRHDENSDAQFYNFPRLVVHIDDHAIAVLTNLYRQLLPPDGVYLDLMSSYRSHLPDDVPSAGVVGLGMNEVELAQNPQLNRYMVHDLNQQPVLPFEDEAFDAVVCAVSVQYLTRPVEVFREVYRVLRPVGVFVVAFSNRCFPTKAVAIWQASSDPQHIELVMQYFQQSASWYGMDTQAVEAAGHDPLYAVWARKSVVAVD
jgi:SAM-dependent methyltransferase